MSSISDPRAQVALRLVNMIGQGPCGSEPIGASSAKSLRIRVIILPLGSAWLLRIDLPNKPWSASPRERRWSGMLTWCPFVQPAGPMDVLSFLFSVLSSRTVSAVKEAPRQRLFGASVAPPRTHGQPRHALDRALRALQPGPGRLERDCVAGASEPAPHRQLCDAASGPSGRGAAEEAEALRQAAPAAMA